MGCATSDAITRGANVPFAAVEQKRFTFGDHILVVTDRGRPVLMAFGNSRKMPIDTNGSVIVLFLSAQAAARN